MIDSCCFLIAANECKYISISDQHALVFLYFHQGVPKKAAEVLDAQKFTLEK